MREEVRSIAMRAKGFLVEAEGMSLYRLAVEISGSGPCLEIGSYCGRSALFLGEGCRERGRYPLFTVDHHEGSAEQQPGQPYFDPDLYDAAEGVTTTLQALRRNIRLAGLQDWVIPIVAASVRLGRYWPPATLSLVFIDGGHSEADAFGDYETWAPTIKPGGYLCIHDIHPDPADGGQAPYHVLQRARAEGAWDHLGTVDTLAILRRQ
ncbi:MAG TPA: class I SAM-dependent methyltransferase [bacterium]|nr:class I SAM-dependent methyltransferase [bacterium]